ncbi:ACT domain-containing protein [Candidatus Micrarchaeota archaeon]|nr:ACT domain-containing protein [Candidatus Micrarchaeota archaeon]
MKKGLLLTVKSRVGLIADLSFILGAAHVNIEDINVTTVGDNTIVNLQVSNDEKALEILKTNGYSPITYEGLILTLNNEPGELAKVSKILADNRILIIRMDVIEKTESKAIVSFEVDKMKKAREVLKDYLI